MKTIYKKVFSAVLSSLMCLSFVACNSTSSNNANLDVSSSELSSYLGRTEKEVFDFIDIDNSKINREDVSEKQSNINLKDKFKYGDAEADITFTINDDRLLLISYRFGDSENNGDKYQKAAFDFAKVVEKKLSENYTPCEYYNGDLNELEESTFTDNTEPSKSWFREYTTEDEFGLIEKFNESPLLGDVKYDELRIAVTLNKFNADSAKTAEVTVALKGGTKTNPQ